MNTAASNHYGKVVKVKAPKVFPTPYGGRLIWTLPGKTRIVCHLKDKDKIRHKKRWSQIMYMYYLLGYKIMELPISDERKEVRWIEESDQLFRLEQRTPSCLHLTGTSTSSQRRSSDLLT